MHPSLDPPDIAKWLVEGDIIELREGHKIYAVVPEHFLGKKGSFEFSRGAITIDGELSYLAGRYVVTNTVNEKMQVDTKASADCHHVYCEGVGYPAKVIDFYQIGRQAAVLPISLKQTQDPEILVVGKAMRRWSFDEKDDAPITEGVMVDAGWDYDIMSFTASYRFTKEIESTSLPESSFIDYSKPIPATPKPSWSRSVILLRSSVETYILINRQKIPLKHIQTVDDFNTVCKIFNILPTERSR